MSCSYHRDEKITVTFKVTVTKKYNPPLNRNFFGGVTWFNKIEGRDADNVHYTLYDFEPKEQPSKRSKFNPGRQPKKGELVTTSYYPLRKKVKGCIEVLTIEGA